MTGETGRIAEALLISAAQREADVAEWMARFSNQAARQQQTVDAFDERLREQVSRADAEVCSVSISWMP